MWIFIIGVGFLFVSVLIYFLMLFDQNYEHRVKKYDIFYCFLLIVIPACTAVSSTFKPKNFAIRFAYFLLLMCPMLFHMMISAFLYNFMHYQFYYYQISTVDEILGANFRLTGSMEVLNIIKQDSKVTVLHFMDLLRIFTLIGIDFFCSIQKNRLKILKCVIASIHAWIIWSVQRIDIWLLEVRNCIYSILNRIRHQNTIVSKIRKPYWHTKFHCYWGRTKTWKWKLIELSDMHLKLVYS